jgi:hypothetical protein
MNEYIPDRWVVLTITSETDPPISKVLASWYGGYLGSDSWKASSGITETLEFDNRYEFMNYSGSKYICYKNNYGMSMYTTSIYTGWKRELDNNPGIHNGTTLDIDAKYII